MSRLHFNLGSINKFFTSIAIKDQPLAFVLGLLIEQLSGESYFDYVHKHILTPARMTRALA